MGCEERWETLEQSANAFAVIVAARVKTRLTRGSPEIHLQCKLRILRWLHRRGRKLDRFVELHREAIRACSLEEFQKEAPSTIRSGDTSAGSHKSSGALSVPASREPSFVSLWQD